MITKDHVDYQSLYEGAYQALVKMNEDSENPIELEAIHNIDDYFMYLGSIAQLVQNGILDPIYLILPIEEELFKIDADTRTITVPDAFRKNGVGVQGDEVAEILYFSIDRYFDIQDLYYKEIFIQWESADKTQKLSPAINKTLLREANKIIFGWPISKEMTGKSGNITFSVRFFERENSKLIYSFSTTQATVKINSGLNINVNFDNDQSINEMLCDKRDLIFNNLKNSAVTESIPYPALKPVFESFEGYEEYEYDDEGNIITIYTGLPKEVDLDPATGTYTFKVKAQFDGDEQYGAGFITYTWYPEDENKNNAGTYVYEVTTDTSRDVNDVYYQYSEEDNKYHKYIFGANQTAFPSGIQLLERYSTYKVDSAGEYYVKAVNTAGKGNIAEARSNICVIPGASTPEFDYSTLGNNCIFDETNKQIIKIKNFHDNNISFDNKAIAGGVLKHQWLESSDNNSYTEISEATNKIYEIPETPANYYKVQLTHERNKNNASALSYPVSVINPPAALTTDNLSYKVDGKAIELSEDATSYSVMQDTAPVFSIELIDTKANQKINEVEVQYQWYKLTGNGWQAVEDANGPSFTAVSSQCYCTIHTKFYGVYDTEKVNSISFTWQT